MKEKAAIDSKFFQKWNSEMSYILGFIAADGNISVRKNRKDSYLLNITNKEKKHLKNIGKILCPEQKIGLKWVGI